MTTHKLVPVRATREMQEAGAEAQDDDDVLSAMANIYRAMVAAAPVTMPAEAGGDDRNVTFQPILQRLLRTVADLENEKDELFEALIARPDQRDAVI